jgi:hypothetical protein
VIGRIWKPVGRLLTDRWFRLPGELAQSAELSRVITYLASKGPTEAFQDETPDRPVFILSAGWRSGSTLLQRLVVSSGEIAVWGEPIGEAAVIPRLAYTLTAIDKEWPPDSFFNTGNGLDDLAGNWIANLTPQMDHFRAAHRSFLMNWLGDPAKSVYGVKRWGIKEVRLTIDHARYLNWLFPNARFLFIYRNPVAAFRSWKGNGWYSPWTRYNTRSPIAFTRHWRLLMKGFLGGHRSVDGMLIKFEDLVGGQIPLEAIAAHIGVERLDPGVLNRKVASPGGGRSRRYERVTVIDRLAIRMLAGPFMKRAGYHNG